MTPSSSSRMRRNQIFSAIFAATAGVSPCVAPTSTHRPAPIEPTTWRSPSGCTTHTWAGSPRCTRPRTPAALPDDDERTAARRDEAVRLRLGDHGVGVVAPPRDGGARVAEGVALRVGDAEAAGPRDGA